MKRILSTLIVAVFFVGTTSCFAYPVSEKFTGGLKDVATSPLHVRDHVKTERDTAKFMPFGIIGGALKGTFYMGKQIVDGSWKIASIPYHVVAEKINTMK